MKKYLCSRSSVLLAMFLMGSCSKDSPREDTETESAPDPDKKAATKNNNEILNPDQALTAKMQTHIECLNSFTGSVNRSRARYFEEVDREKGPNEKTRFHANLMRLGKPSACIEKLRKAATVEPKLPGLDEAGLAFAQGLDDLKAPMDEAFAYLDKEDFKDDGWAKGQALHPKLVTGFDAFYAASTKMDSEVSSLNGELQLRILAEIEKRDGRKINFGLANTNLHAKLLVELSAVDTVEELDLEPHQAALENFSKALREFDAYAKDHEEEAKGILMLSVYFQDANSFEKAAKALMRRKRDGTAFSRSEKMRLASSSDSVDGSPGQVVSRYNSMIKTANGL